MRFAHRRGYIMKGLIGKMNEDLLNALTDLCKEKGIEKDVILDALEAALIAGYKRNFASAQNVCVELDRETGKISVYAQKTVVDEVMDPQQEISLEDAKKLSGAYEQGDVVNIEVTPRDFGRIAAMTAKQVVTQRIREAERGIIFSEYTQMENDIVTGKVERIEHETIYVDIGKAEAVLPKNEQTEGEYYGVGDMIKCYVSEVKNATRGTQIILSRTHPGLVKKLFSREVPEIQDGLVEIKSVSREAGSRTKIAVYSEDPNIDAQGSCIGPKGTRVQAVSEELNMEKIDIIKWSEDPVEYISAALSPSKVLSVTVDEDEKSAKVVVPENQLSLAIGKSGQNVRLAARLTGWKIDISAE